MKLPLFLTLGIISAGILWQVHAHQRLTVLREQQRHITQEIRSMGASPEILLRASSTKASLRNQTGADVKNLLAKLLVSLSKMKQRSSNDGSELEDQRRLMEELGSLLDMNETEFKMLLEELGKNTSIQSGDRGQIASLIVMILCQQHPLKALTLCTESSGLLLDDDQKMNLVRSALTTLAVDDPYAALDWIRKNEKKYSDLVSTETKASLIKGAAINDLPLALHLIRELQVPPEHLMSELTSEARTPEQQSAFLAALRGEAAKIPDPEAAKELLDTGIGRLLSAVSRTGYEQTLLWLQSAGLNEQETGRLVNGLNYYDTRADTGKWLSWLATQSPGDEAHITSTNLIQQWTEDDYQTSGQWLTACPPGPAKERATISYAQTIAPYDPEVAAQWIQTLPSAKQSDAFQMAYQNIKYKDEAAAREFAAKHGVKEE